MQKSEQIGALAAALAKAQASIQGAVKDAANPFFKSKYADLASVWEACRKPLTGNDLSVVQSTDVDEKGGMLLFTTLAHKSGEWVTGVYPVNPPKADPQGLGSALTYARRYALASMVGVFQIDDDGEASMGREEKKNKTTNTAPIKGGFDDGSF